MLDASKLGYRPIPVRVVSDRFWTLTRPPNLGASFGPGPGPVLDSFRTTYTAGLPSWVGVYLGSLVTQILPEHLQISKSGIPSPLLVLR